MRLPLVASAALSRSRGGSEIPCALKLAGGLLLLAVAGCAPFQLQNWQPDQLVMPIEEASLQVAKIEQPSNYRDWSPDQAVLSYAEFDGDQVHVHNIRNCTYLSTDNYVVAHYDKTFDLGKLRSVDFITVPFQGLPSMAHTMLSFGFEGDEYVAVSVEIRKEKGEQYQFLNGILRQYEIMYVVGDEQDLIKLRTSFRKDDVYLYRGKATQEQMRALFVDVFQRVNKLKDEPEFYNTFSNNCTTNIVRHVNNLAPNRVPYDYHVLLPGLAAQLAYELGLLDSEGSFEETKEHARITDLALRYADSPDFSVRIREEDSASPRPLAGERQGVRAVAAESRRLQP
jgi:hypothetical protein